MKKKGLFIGYTVSSLFLTGCSVSEFNNKDNSEDVIEISEEEKGLKEKQEKIKIGLSSYKEGVSPLYIDGILVVNKEYSLPKDFTNKLEDEVLEQFNLMKADAKKDGLDINIRSGFRSNEVQEMLYTNYVKKDGVEKASRYSARPGHSEHETGLGIDISNGDYETSIGDWFTDTPQAKWLYENAYKYGFILRYPEGKEDITGYKYESWHYRYVGKEHSQYFNQNNLTLEEYLGLK